MAIHTCPRCGYPRSKARATLCSVCYLLESLVEEHDAGDHRAKPNPSCAKCKPKHNARLQPIADRVHAQLRRDVLTSMHEGNHRSASSSARQGRTEQPVRMSVMSHASCEHESTPKARAKCRAQRRKASQ